MLIVLGSWLILALSTTMIGWCWWWLMRRWGVADCALPPELLSLSGVAALIVVLTPLSLIASIGPGVQLLFGLFILMLFYWRRHAIWAAVCQHITTARPTAWWLTAGLLAVPVGNLLLRIVVGGHNPDEQLYYLQTLQWIEQLPAVPGLGNLHGRLAFNMSVFLPTALYRIPTLAGPYYPLPSYLLLLLAVAAGRGVARFFSRDSPRAWWQWAPLLLFFFLVYTLQPWLASPAPDYALLVFLSFIFLQYANFWGPDGRQLMVLLLLSCVAVTIKLSALPILLLPVHALWTQRRANSRILRRALLLVVVIFGPWLLRSVLLSGYLLYPLPTLDLISVDWKIPSTLVQTEQRIVINIARQVRARQAVLSPPCWQQWLPVWWRWQLTNPLHAGLLVLAALSPVVAPRRWRWLAAGQRIGWLVAALGCLFWFVTAPDFRFGISFLVVAASWPWLTLPVPARWSGLATGLGLLVVGWGLHSLREPVYKLRHSNAGATQLLWPMIPPMPPTTTTVVNGHVVHLAQQQGACGSTPIPCTYHVQPGLEYRGASLAEGFRIRTTPRNATPAGAKR